MSSSAPAAMPDNNQRRVAIIARLDQPGGVQSVVLSLIKGLNASGIRPELIWDVPPSSRLLEGKGVQASFHPLPLRASSRLLDRVPTTVRYFLNLANIVTCWQAGKPYDFYYVFYNGFLLPEETPHLRYLNGPPLLPQLDLASPGPRGWPYRFIRWVYRKALHRRFPAYEFHRQSRYVINSEYTARLFEEAYGVRLPVVHPPIDTGGRSFTAEDIHQRDTITFLSRFVDYKRPEMVLQLAKCYPQYRFVLMGGVKPQNRAYYDTLRKQVVSSGKGNVSFFDNPSDSKVREELARTRFYIFPAVNEHFGMATAEAIASGAVPFVHDSGGQKEIVPDPRLRFRDGSFLQQFSAVFELPPEELNTIRFTLREHVKQFSEEVFIEKMLKLANFNGQVRN